MSERAFRLLRWVANQPEPLTPAQQPSAREVGAISALLGGIRNPGVHRLKRAEPGDLRSGAAAGERAVILHLD
jgi:hypothetical protein